MTYPFNMLSRCPVLAVPSGRAANNVPTGIQLVGPTYEDTAVFQAAAAYEAANPLFFSGDNYPNLGN
jgi:amidase